MTNRLITAEILSQGEEVLSGQIADTNSAWLSQRLTQMGVDVVRHTAVGDRLGDLASLIREIAARADLCICTGGLGPTCDDLTSEAVGLAFDVPLTLDEIALGQIEERYRQRGQAMPAINRKQAMLPRGAVRIDNHWGTAPGFSWWHGEHWLAFLPGVPQEMREMFNHIVEPEIRARWPVAPPRSVVMRTFGAGESLLQEWLMGVELPVWASLGFRVDFPYVDVKFRFDQVPTDADIEALLRRTRKSLGDSLFAEVSGQASHLVDMADVIGEMLAAAGQSLAVVEAGCGGELARHVAAAPWFAELVTFADVARLERKFGICVQMDRAGDEWPSALARIAARVRADNNVDYTIVQVRCSQVQDGSIALFVLGPRGGSFHRRVISGGPDRWPVSAAAWALSVLRRELIDSRPA